ncbi:MAG TPA: cupin domain-containing protein [Pyrinomonadaceae bacterium]|nr:cupin domain-containing protein [Pyrinomonadaceae bacterium]
MTMKFYDWDNEHTTRTVANGYDRGVAVGEKLMMAHVELEEDTITTPHSHEYEEIIYVVSGKWQVTIGEDVFVVESNQSLVVPPNIEHSAIALEKTLAVVATNYRPEWRENSDFWLHYNEEKHLWAV